MARNEMPHPNDVFLDAMEEIFLRVGFYRDFGDIDGKFTENYINEWNNVMEVAKPIAITLGEHDPHSPLAFSKNRVYRRIIGEGDAAEMQVLYVSTMASYTNPAGVSISVGKYKPPYINDDLVEQRLTNVREYAQKDPYAARLREVIGDHPLDLEALVNRPDIRRVMYPYNDNEPR